MSLLLKCRIMKKKLFIIVGIGIISVCSIVNIDLTKLSKNMTTVSIENLQAMATGGESAIDPNDMHGYKKVNTTNADGTLKCCCEQDRPESKCSRKSELNCK